MSGAKPRRDEVAMPFVRSLSLRWCICAEDGRLPPSSVYSRCAGVTKSPIWEPPSIGDVGERSGVGGPNRFSNLTRSKKFFSTRKEENIKTRIGRLYSSLFRDRRIGLGGRSPWVGGAALAAASISLSGLAEG